MHDLFRRPPARFKGMQSYPELPYLRRLYGSLIDDIHAYYRRAPKRVDSGNLFASLLLHVPLQPQLSDDDYIDYVEDVSRGLFRAMGVVTSYNRGKVHERGVTLGTKTDEVVIGTRYRDVDISAAKTQWWKWSAVRYLYHTRIDLNMPIMNNQSPGKGFGVTTVDLPMLALQRRYWLRWQSVINEQPETIYRFIGGFVLPNAVESYLDIAFFNRLSRKRAEVGVSKFPSPHPFYAIDLSKRTDDFIRKIMDDQEKRDLDMEQALYTTPAIIKSNLWDVVQLPPEPRTRQNEWALFIARIPYIKYLVDVYVHQEKGDRMYVNQVYNELIDLRNNNAFSHVGRSDIVKWLDDTVNSMIILLESKNQGWT